MPSYILDIIGVVLISAAMVRIVMLERSNRRLREVLVEAPVVVGALDAATQRLDESSEDLSKRFSDQLESVNGRIAVVQRTAKDLESASRNAEEVAVRLESALRQGRRLAQARSTTPDRSMVEPKGFSDRAALRGAALANSEPAAPPMLAPIAFSGQRDVARPVSSSRLAAGTERAVRVALSSNSEAYR